jgi:hypothetical protein
MHSDLMACVGVGLHIRGRLYGDVYAVMSAVKIYERIDDGR